MEDLPAVVPLLVYRDIERAHELLVGALGFEPGLIERTPNGDVVHGEVHAGGQVLRRPRVRRSRPRAPALGVRHPSGLGGW